MGVRTEYRETYSIKIGKKIKILLDKLCENLIIIISYATIYPEWPEMYSA